MDPKTALRLVQAILNDPDLGPAEQVERLRAIFGPVRPIRERVLEVLEAEAEALTAAEVAERLPELSSVQVSRALRDLVAAGRVLRTEAPPYRYAADGLVVRALDEVSGGPLEDAVLAVLELFAPVPLSVAELVAELRRGSHAELEQILKAHVAAGRVEVTPDGRQYRVRGADDA